MSGAWKVVLGILGGAAVVGGGGYLVWKATSGPRRPDLHTPEPIVTLGEPRQVPVGDELGSPGNPFPSHAAAEAFALEHPGRDVWWWDSSGGGNVNVNVSPAEAST